MTSIQIQKIDGNASEMKKDLLVYYSTAKMDYPVLLAQPHSED